jgi:hypothetical protein
LRRCVKGIFGPPRDLVTGGHHTALPRNRSVSSLFRRGSTNMANVVRNAAVRFA